MRRSTRVWLTSIVSALISSAATAVLTALASPEMGAVTVAKAAGIGALVGVANLLAKSPLPDSRPPGGAP